MTSIKLVPMVESMLETIRMQQQDYVIMCRLCKNTDATTFMDLCDRCDSKVCGQDTTMDSPE